MSAPRTVLAQPRAGLAACAFLAVALLTSCGRADLDGVLDKTARAVDELSAVLSDVRDSETLAKLRPRIDALGDDLVRLRDEAAALARRAIDDPSLREAATAARARLVDAVHAVEGELARIAEHDELRASLTRLRETVGSLLDGAPAR